MFPSLRSLPAPTGARRALGAGLIAGLTLALSTLGAQAQRDPLAWFHPPNGSQGMTPGTAITLRFDVDVEAQSLYDAFGVEPAVAGDWIASGSRNFSFYPEAPLAAETDYRVTIGTGVKDLRGNPVFRTERGWRFATGPDNAQVTYGGALPLRYLEPAGERVVQLNPGYPRTELDLALYRLDMAALAARYAALVPWQNSTIDLEGLTEVARWSQRIDTNDPDSRVRIPDGVQPGLYVLDAGNERVKHGQALLVLSGHAITAKRGLDGVTAWVATVPDGEPAAGAAVTVYDANGMPVASGSTDGDGLAADLGGEGAAFVAAQTADGTALVGLDAQWRSGWWWWGWMEDAPARAGGGEAISRFAAHVHTDRPIYRPGHEVHWKASLRAVTREGYQVIDATNPITVGIRDAGNNLVTSLNPTPDEFGSVAGDLRLDEDAALGDWRLEIQVGTQTLYGTFQVEEYVKPDFEVVLETDEPWYVRGDTATVEVQADYYFGQPVAEAEATVRVYEYWSWRGENRPLREFKTMTDEEGHATVEVPLPSADSGARWVWLEAEVVDASRRPVASQSTVIVHPAEFAMRMSSQRYGVQAGSPVELTLATADHDGLPMAGVDATVELRQYQRGGYRVLRTERVTTGADGSVPVAFEGLETGWYNLQATAMDARGNEVTAWSYAWIWDRARPWYWYGGLELNLDQNQYAPGDTARLLVKAPYTETRKALVTVERDQVLDEYVVDLDGATTVELPITADHAPNATVTVAAWQDENYDYSTSEGQLVLAQTQLVVPATDKRLRVSLEPDLPEHRPGDEATWTLRVTDAEGNPVRAQASVAVVDKAVLALAQDRSGDIFDAFWTNWPTSVGTFDSLKASQGSAGFPENARGGDGGGAPAPGSPEPSPDLGQDTDDEDESQATPRREFPDTALWTATVETGADGSATITMAVPDSLTTWVALARAITIDARAGQGTGEMLVTQPVIADIALPRFAVQGDRFALDVLGRNYADPEHPLSSTCDLTAPGLTLLDGNQRPLELPFNRTAVARYSVVASTLGSTPVTARLASDGGGDAIELPLEVAPFTVPERFASAGAVEAAKVFERFDVPFHAVPEASEVELRLAPGVAQSVLDGVEELVGFPYGCVEQTMSRMLPNAVVGKLVDTLGIDPGPELADLPEYMSVGLQKLYGFQNPSGGWGWWHWSNSDTQVYLTAYVLHGLLLAREAGYDVDQAVLDRGFAWLRDGAKEGGEGRPDGPEEQGGPRQSDPRIQAYAAHVLTLDGRDDGGLALAVFEERADFEPFALASLAMALHGQGEGAKADLVVDELIAMAETTATGAFWPMEAERTEWGYWRWNWYQWRTMASAEKYTATALQAILLRRPDDPVADAAARWLLAHRRGVGWYTTHATAFAVLGLTDYVTASGELEADYQWSVSLDGRTLASGRVDAGNVLEPIDSIVLTGDALEPGAHELVIEKQGMGSLYYTLLGRMALYYDGFEATEAEGLGITLNRDYQPVAGRGTPEDWRVGDIVNVRLTLETKEDLGYVLLEDMLPAGFEPLNERLETEGRVPGASPWRWWGYERRELRDDKVSFFATWLRAGSHQFEYAARVVTPGEFSARPAEAYAMYRPEVWGRTASMRVSVAARSVAARPDLAGDFDRDCRLTGFDAALIAADWATSDSARDLNGDGRVSVADIALAHGRGDEALACGDAVPPAPPVAGAIDVALREAAGGGAEGTLVVELIAAGDAPVGAWQATLDLPEGVVLDEVVAGDRLSEAMLLDPRAEDGTLSVGGWAEADGRAGEVLARLRLRTVDGEGGEAVRLSAAELSTATGAAYEVRAEGELISPPPVAGLRIWLPYAAR